MNHQKWNDFRFDIGPYTNCSSAMKTAIVEFGKTVLKKLIGKNTVLFMFKIQTEEEGFKSITHLQEFHWNKTPKDAAAFEGNEVEFEKLVWDERDQSIQTLVDLLTLCEESWEMHSDRYQNVYINYIVFSYKIIPSSEVQQITKKSKLENKFKKPIDTIVNKEEPQIYSGHYLPTTMDFTKWGDFEIASDFKSAIVKKINTRAGKSSKIEYHITINDLNLNVDLKIGNLTAFSWIDSIERDKINSNLSTFKRMIKKNIYFFEDGVLQFHSVSKTCNKITALNKSTYRSKNFITYDIETKTIEGKMIPYCICLYDGSNYKVFYITDYENLNLTTKEQSEKMLKDSINFLLKPKYSGYIIYAHNFSYFDGIFLMKIFTEIDGIVKPIIRDGKFIETKIYFDWKKGYSAETIELTNNISNDKILKTINEKTKTCKHNISFRDSLLLLPAKLSELAKTFDVENKDIFPYKFVNETSTSFVYEGKIPNLHYFNVSDMGEEVSERFKNWKIYRARFNNKKWNLKNETILYCKNDVKILWDILDNYSKIIFENWYVDLLKSPTISSLAFKLFRSNYLPVLDSKIKIPTITGKIYEDIKKSYTGGAVDVYKPYGENVKVYDVKSLYPSVMLNKPMPIGNPIYFEGNILKNKNYWIKNSSILNDQDQKKEKPFGFFYVKITTPKILKEPIIQVKKKLNGLTRTIAPLGSWKGWYFSEELYNAEKYGYKFEILKGYTFDKGYIFKDYVEKLYTIKESHPKGSPMNLNAKLLLNSLYGRFGMSPFSEEHIILPSSLSNQFVLDDKFDIVDVIDFQNKNELISYKIKQNPNEDNNNEENKFKNVSIVVASAITAYGRIHMSQFKNNPELGDLLYSDTDCIAITGDLNNKYIGKGIGEMELEKKFIKVVYLAPKVYIGLTPNKKEPSKIEVVAVIKGINVKKKTKYFNFDDFVLLLNKNSTFIMKHEKWSRNVSNASVTIEPLDYKLIVTGSKRNIIYKNNVFIDTEPLIINE